MVNSDELEFLIRGAFATLKAATNEAWIRCQNAPTPSDRREAGEKYAELASLRDRFQEANLHTKALNCTITDLKLTLEYNTKKRVVQYPTEGKCTEATCLYHRIND